MRARAATIAAVMAALAAAAPARAAAPAPCPGEPIDIDLAIEGDFAADREGSYVLLPFEVPAGTTAVRVKYCHDQPPSTRPVAHTLDLGLYEPRRDRDRPWGVEEFRGWGGSSHPDVTVSPEGFSSLEDYLAERRVPGKTTRAFRPGPIPAGEWAVELGLASIASVAEGDPDGSVAYRVEIELADDPAFADEPYEPAPYDATPARRERRWYAGDLHVHGEHSALGDAPLREVFDYAFRPVEQGGAGLDFVTLSDYVSGTSWTEVGRHQPDYPGKLIVRSAEIITYRGHMNSHANTTTMDYRHGPLLVRRPDGSLERVRDARPPSETLARIRAAGGFAQINHPTIFPSQVPGFAALCRGCPWDYAPAETDYSLVDAIEIATGPPGIREGTQPGPNPFTVTAIDFWERALAAGHRIAAVGSSDSHNAGRTPDPVTQAPIGTATTMVLADELSEEGIRRGVEAGHTYVKVFGSDGPDLRLEARAAGSDAPPAIMGDALRADRAELRARVLGAAPGARPGSPEPFELLVVRDGVPARAAVVTSDDFELRMEVTEPGRYRLQLQRGTAIEAVSSPIYVEAAGEDAGGGGGGDRSAERPGRGAPRDRRDGSGGGGNGSKEGGGGSAGGALARTGAALAPLAALGALLAAGGLALRRRSRR